MSQQATILLVDDDATVRKTLELQLSTRGYHIESASSGLQALSLLKTRDVDLMLLDIRMPGMNGNEVLHEVRRNRSALELPVLMLTSSEGTEEMLHAFNNGANDYLIKPTQLEILAARIETQLSLKSMNSGLMEQKTDLKHDFLRARVESQLDKAELEKEMEGRMEAEKALVRSEKRFKVLYDNTPAMYFSLDLDGGILSVNRYAAYILGYQRKDLVGRNIAELCREEDRETLRTYLRDTVAEPGSILRWQLCKLCRNGNGVVVRETARLVENPSGDRNILLVGVDITDADPAID